MWLSRPDQLGRRRRIRYGPVDSEADSEAEAEGDGDGDGDGDGVSVGVAVGVALADAEALTTGVGVASGAWHFSVLGVAPGVILSSGMSSLERPAAFVTHT